MPGMERNSSCNGIIKHEPEPRGNCTAAMRSETLAEKIKVNIEIAD